MKLLLLLLLIIGSVNVFAFPIGYQTKEIYNDITSNASSASTNAAAIVLKRAYQNYELDATSGISGTSTVTFASEQIPANSIITNSFYEVDTQLVSASSNTIALTCGSSTIQSAADLTSATATTINAGSIVSQTIATHSNVGAAACTPTYTIGAGASGLTAGVIRFFVEYLTRY